ncbi:MAG: diguanylate cyclase, partial [Chloroflexota bacterium]
LKAVDLYANPDDRSEFLRRIMQTGVVVDEVHLKRKDGSEFDCARNVVARRDQHGNLLEVQGVLRDITQEKRTRAELERLARFDTLTGLLNRYSIVEKLSEWIRHSRRYHARLSIVLLDIDHFKRINDTYGHAAGDRVLQETASRLMGSIRQADFVGRYGGEEFLIVLPRTDIDGAAFIAERIRTNMEHAPLYVDDETPVRVTISLGVTQWHEDDKDDSLLVRVDSAMYRAKEGGRNRVEVVPDTYSAT